MSLLKTKLQAVLEEKNTKVIPTNIRAGVIMFGVAGTIIEGNPEAEQELAECEAIADEILGADI